MRHIEAEGMQALRDGDVRPRILLLRRRVHDDETLVAGADAKVTAKAGIDGGRTEITVLRWQHPADPGPERFVSLVQKLLHLCRPRCPEWLVLEGAVVLCNFMPANKINHRCIHPLCLSVPASGCRCR